MRWREREGFRFLVAGALNTAVGYGMYLALNLMFDYRAAYTLSFAFGIVLSYLFNSIYVFRQPLHWKRLAIYPMVYVMQYLVGLLAIWIFVAKLRLPEAFAPIAAVAINIPLTFIATRYILTGDHHVQNR